MRGKKHLLFRRRKGPVWTFLDRNRSVIAAGSVDGTLTSDGKAEIVAVDTENKLSGSGIGYVWAGPKAAPAHGDPGRWYRNIDDSKFTLGAGNGCFFKIKPSDASDEMRAGYDDTLDGTVAAPYWRLYGNELRAGTPNVHTIVGGVDLEIGIIQLSTRHHFVQKLNGVWVLAWPDVTAIRSTAYVGISNYDLNGSDSKTGLTNLVANGKPQWDTAFDAETDTDASPAATDSVDRVAGSAEIDCGDITLPSGGAITLQIRRVSATNYTTLTINADGSADIKETIASAEGASLGAVAAGGITDSASLKILDNAGSVTVFSANVSKVTATLTDHAEAVLVYLNGLGTAGALSEITTHPINLGTATDRVICPQAGDTWISTADHWLDFTIPTIPTGNSVRIAFNRTDDDNCGVLDIDSNGKPLVYNRTGGADGAAVITGSNADVSAGNRVLVRVEDGNCALFVGTAQISTTYTSWARTAKTGKVLSLGTAGALSELITWPWDLSGLMPRGV